MARDFERGSSEYIHASIGALDHTGSGGLTFAAVIFRESAGSNQCIIALSNSTPAYRFRFYINSSNNLVLTNNGGADSGYTPGGTWTTSQWVLVAVTKAGGTATPRFHVLDMATGAWVHGNGSATSDNSGAPGGTGIVQIGRHNATNHFDGRMAVAGAWKRELTDAQVESLAGGLRAWLSQKPDGLWPLNQGDVATPVVDWTGGGANQAAISGTTISANHPLRWRWGGTVQRVLRAPTGSTVVTSGFDASVSVGSGTVVFRDQYIGATALDASNAPGSGTVVVNANQFVVATTLDASSTPGTTTVVQAIEATALDASSTPSSPAVEQPIMPPALDASETPGTATVQPGNVDLVATALDASGGQGSPDVLPGGVNVIALAKDSDGEQGYALILGGASTYPDTGYRQPRG